MEIVLCRPKEKGALASRMKRGSCSPRRSKRLVGRPEGTWKSIGLLLSEGATKVQRDSSRREALIDEVFRNLSNVGANLSDSDKANVVFNGLYQVAGVLEPVIGSTLRSLAAALSAVTCEAGTGLTFATRVHEAERSLRKQNDDADKWVSRKDSISAKLEVLAKVVAKARLEELAWHDRVDGLKQSVAELHIDKLNASSEEASLLEGTGPLHVELNQLNQKLKTLEKDISNQHDLIRSLCAEKKTATFQLAALKVKSSVQLERCEVLVPVTQLVECEEALDTVNKQVDSFEAAHLKLRNQIATKETRLEQIQREKTQAETKCQQRKLALSDKRFVKERSSTPRPDWKNILNSRLPCLKQRLIDYSPLKTQVGAILEQETASNHTPGLTAALVYEMFKAISTKDEQAERIVDPLLQEQTRRAKLKQTLRSKAQRLALFRPD